MKPVPITLTGKIIDGTNNSNSWFPQFLPKLYPGTLNVLLDSYRPDIEWHTDIVIPEGKYEGKTIRIANCKINNLPALIVKPPQFKYLKRYNWVEIGHTERLRSILNLTTETRVNVTFTQGLQTLVYFQ
jgi:CTP-dependent riboflavin kinase